MAAQLPRPILTRSKLGFPVPIQSWFRGDLSRTARSILLDRREECSRFFDPKQLEALLARHRSGAEDLSGELYALIVFVLWHRLFIESPSVTPSPPALAGREAWTA